MPDYVTACGILPHCSDDVCLGRHHELLHQTKLVPAHDVSRTSLFSLISQTNQKSICLEVDAMGPVLPASALNPVDNESDTILMSERCLKHQLSKSSTVVKVSAVGWTQIVNAG